MLSLKLHTSDIVNEDVDEEDQNMLLTFEESRAEGWPIYTFIYYFIDLFIYLFIHSFVWIDVQVARYLAFSRSLILT